MGARNKLSLGAFLHVTGEKHATARESDFQNEGPIVGGRAGIAERKKIESGVGKFHTGRARDGTHPTATCTGPGLERREKRTRLPGRLIVKPKLSHGNPVQDPQESETMVLIGMAQEGYIEIENAKASQLRKKDPLADIPPPVSPAGIDHQRAATRKLNERSVSLTHVEEKNTEIGTDVAKVESPPRTKSQPQGTKE